MQYSVSVKVVSVMFHNERVCILLSWLVGGVQATSI
jgi:hypothetical protein